MNEILKIWNYNSFNQSSNPFKKYFLFSSPSNSCKSIHVEIITFEILLSLSSIKVSKFLSNFPEIII